MQNMPRALLVPEWNQHSTIKAAFRCIAVREQLSCYRPLKHFGLYDIVNAWNPAPLDGYFIPLFTSTVFHTSQLVQDVSHQHYDWILILVNSFILYVPGSRVAICGMVIRLLTGNPYNGYVYIYIYLFIYTPTSEVDDHPLPKGTMGVLTLTHMNHDTPYSSHPSCSSCQETSLSWCLPEASKKAWMVKASWHVTVMASFWCFVSDMDVQNLSEVLLDPFSMFHYVSSAYK